MRIACLQFSPKLGDVQANIDRADLLLKQALPQEYGLLVLPELAFSGLPRLRRCTTIKPYLEPSGAGPSSEWARNTAKRLRCVVTVGYPEIASTNAECSQATSENSTAPASLCYNSTITVSAEGETLAHYRKTHLYYTDETWAQESDTKWLTTTLPIGPAPLTDLSTREGSDLSPVITTFGICMDLNPYQFTASWTLYELAMHTLSTGTQLLSLSMSWLTNLSSTELTTSTKQPDLDTLNYWIERIVPLVESKDEEVIVIFANRCGEEPGDVRYAGSSWVGKVGKGKIKIWDIAGRDEERVINVDTRDDPEWTLQTVDREAVDSTLQ
ncbi:MAG: hypothetical protein Q9191_002821 [Dirinaria sp. TL-2023a]